MPAINAITPDKLARLIGLPHCPAIIDVRADQEFASDPRLLPGSVRRDHTHIAAWSGGLAGRSAVIVDAQGGEVGEGGAAWLRHEGVSAEMLDGGTLGWAAAGLPMVPAVVLPPRDAQGRTVWVTRARPKVDRIACPWLIRRFVDPAAVFLFVSPSEVTRVAERFGAAPFDIAEEGVVWGHERENCTFNAMVARFGLAAVPGFAYLALIVRGADTARPDLAPRQRAGRAVARLVADVFE
jgi:rhodanese-related sulfurtransferase